MDFLDQSHEPVNSFLELLGCVDLAAFLVHGFRQVLHAATDHAPRVDTQPGFELVHHETNDLVFVGLQVATPLHGSEVFNDDGQEHVHQDEHDADGVEEEHERPQHAVGLLEVQVAELSQHHTQQRLQRGHKAAELLQLDREHQEAEVRKGKEHEAEDYTEVAEFLERRAKCRAQQRHAPVEAEKPQDLDRD